MAVKSVFLMDNSSAASMVASSDVLMAASMASLRAATMAVPKEHRLAETMDLKLVQ